MIARERLEELIEKGATIYAVTLDDKVGFINFIDYEGKVLENTLKFRVKIKPDLSNWYGCEPNWSEDISLKILFETKEDAVFAKEFKNIKRIEVLNLPTFEELKNFERFDFKAKDGHRYTIHFISGFNTLAITGIIENKYYGKATKENYLEACKIAKKIFLGGKIDD